MPEDVAFLTAGVDCQDDRLEVTVVGWCRDDESYILDHRILYGDPSTPQMWGLLDATLSKAYMTEDGRQLGIRASCVDSGGHFTNSVYQYCKRNWGKRIFAIKGVGGEGKPIAGRPSKNNSVKCPLFPIGVDTAKDLLFARMRIQDQGAATFISQTSLMMNISYSLRLKRSITNSSVDTKKRVFQKIRTRNEALDCFVYAMAAYAILNVDVNSISDKIKRHQRWKKSHRRLAIKGRSFQE